MLSLPLTPCLIKKRWIESRERSSRSFDPICDSEASLLLQKPHALVLLLPDADRQILEMAFFEGKTSVEIANETGFPIDTIGTRLRGVLSTLTNGIADVASVSEDTRLKVLDLDTHPEFTARSLRRREVAMQMEVLRPLTHSFVQSPDTILQELLNAAVELCGADSADISLETEEKSDENYYHWVATAGQYNGFMNAVLPRYPSACGTCLERGRPQLIRVRQRFFDIMGIQAPLVTDGILLPWQVEDTRGTIVIMAHGRKAAFNRDDGADDVSLCRLRGHGCSPSPTTARAVTEGETCRRRCDGEQTGAPDQKSAAKSHADCVYRGGRPERPQYEIVGTRTLRRFAAIVRIGQ